MNKDIIGIKLSDGSFYPVLTVGEAFEKKLTLTTARDGQTSIRLHLFRSATGTMEDAEYIDSLRIDGLTYHVMNEPSIALSVAIDEDGTISARLSDAETGKVSSKTMEITLEKASDLPDFDVDFDIPEPKDSSFFDVPPLTEEDFDFDLPDTGFSPTASNISDISPSSARDTDEDFSMQNSPFTDSSLYDTLSSENGKKKGVVSVPLAICIICAIVCVCALGIMIFIAPPKWLAKITQAPAYNFETQLIPEEPVDNGPSPNEDIIIVTSEPVIPEEPVIVEPEAGEDSKQIKHLIRWGDTLWDLAGCYYKNPWAYHRIVKENNIKDPDFIVSGTVIIIPR